MAALPLRAGADARPAFVLAGRGNDDEAHEIAILKEGYPAVVTPGEDHATRIQILLGWLQKQAMTGAMIDPIAKQRVQEHLAVHYQYLKKTQPQAARQLEQGLAAMEQPPQMQQPEGVPSVQTNPHEVGQL